MIVFWILTMILIVVGFLVGYVVPVKISSTFFPYMSVVFLAFLDSFLFNLYLVRLHLSGAWRVALRLVLEVAYGCLLIFLGEKGGLDLYLVAVIPLGASSFYSLHKMLMGKFTVSY